MKNRLNLALTSLNFFIRFLLLLKYSTPEIIVCFRRRYVLKTVSEKNMVFFFISAFVILLFSECSQTQNSIQKRLKQHADGIKVINTHEHQHWPEEYGSGLTYGFWHLVHSSYLMSDISSAGGAWLNMNALDTLSLSEHWDINGEALDFCRATSYYGHFVRGFQKLYGFEQSYFTEDNITPLSEKITTNYTDYRSWFDKAFHKAGFELMFLDQYWKPFNTQIDTQHYALVFHINPLVMGVSSRPGPDDTIEGPYYEAQKAGIRIKTLDDYLEFCDYQFEKNLQHKAVCVKNSLAYSRSLDFEEVSYKRASKLFRKTSASLTIKEEKALQDFLFHWIIKKSIEYDLPIQIHTGYLAGNGNTLDNGKPVKLNNLFRRYPRARFVLFHGGYPWTGEFAAFGKMFQNVYLDLVWLPQISRQEAVHAVDEILDTVPYNKLFWGGDCAFIEESTGSLEFGKDVFVEVLTKRIERGLLTEDLAREILDCILRENAIEVFKLESLLR